MYVSHLWTFPWLGVEQDIFFTVYCIKYADDFVMIFCYIMNFLRIYKTYLPIFFRAVSLALGQSCDCPSASEATLKDMGKLTKI